MLNDLRENNLGFVAGPFLLARLCLQSNVKLWENSLQHSGVVLDPSPLTQNSENASY